MANANQIAKQKAAQRRQLKDLEHKAQLSQQALADAQAEAADWLSAGSDKGLGDQAPPIRPQNAFTRLAPGTSDTLAQQTPYTARDWIQSENRFDAKQPEGYGAPMSMDMDEPPLPFGGATSMADVQAYFDAQGKAEQMDELVDIYQGVLSNIMAADDIADKGGAIATAAGELQKLMASMKALKEAGTPENKASDKPGDFLVVEDPQKSTTWHLQVKKDGVPDHTLMGAAAAALSPAGYRGQPYAGPNKAEALSKLKVLYAAEKMPFPGGKELDDVETKDTQSLFQKFMSWVKAGARHSATDQEHLQQAHDHLKMAGADCGMKVLKAADGSYRWFGWVSNKWRDRDTAKHPTGEIITEAAHKEYVAWLDAHPDQAPQWWTWHTPVRKDARADWWDYADGFLVMSGPVPAGEEKGYLALDEPVAMSHGFITLDRDPAAGLIKSYRTFEVSDLPLEKAANPWTAFDVVRKELTEMGFTPDKRAYFVKVFGEERTKQLEAETESMGKSLDQAGVEAKEKGAPEVVPAVAAAPELPEHILAQVKQLLNTDGLQAALVALGQQNKALADQVAELKKTDDAKIAEKIAPKVKPMQWGYQASQAKDNELTDEQKEKLKVGQSKSWVNDAFADLVH